MTLYTTCKAVCLMITVSDDRFEPYRSVNALRLSVLTVRFRDVVEFVGMKSGVHVSYNQNDIVLG